MAAQAGVKKRSGGLSELSVNELQREIAKRHRSVVGLERKRQRLLERVAKIDEQIRQHGGATRGGSGRVIAPRQKNDGTLVDALIEALTGKTMGVTEVAEFVKAKGYKTMAPSFRTIVNQALIASGKFKRIGRGQYTAK